MKITGMFQQDEFSPSTIDEVESALAYISPDLERGEWANIGMAIRSEFPNGFDIFDSWSQGGGSYKAADVLSTWNSINGTGGITIATLFGMARDAGYKPNKQPNILVDEAARLKRQAERQAATQKAESEKAQKQKAAALTAAQRWEAATEPNPEHPYLKKKAIQPVGIRQEGDNLLLPVQDANKKLISVQQITPDGEKKFHFEGATSGGYMRLPGSTKTIVICEGYATGASINCATGHGVAIAFSCSNLMPVAASIRQKLPDADIVIAADSQPETTLLKAMEVAAAINARLAVPTVDSDFNDMALAGQDVAGVINQGEVVAVMAAPEWEEPLKIEKQLRPVQTLDDEMLPDRFRAWIKDMAHRMQTPPDYAAVAAVTVTASIIGTACAIRPKERDSWTVIPNLWGAAVGRPSVLLKTPSMKEPMDMLTRLQIKAREIFEEEQASHKFDQQVAEAQGKQLEKDIQKAATAKTQDPVKLEILKQQFLADEETVQPVRRLFKTNETSIQSQTVLQTENPRGILTFRDELTGLLVKWDSRESEDERAYFLEGWNGDQSYTDYKIGRGLTDAENICISLFGGIQPDKLRRYLHQSMNGNNDGLVQRLQLAVYPDEPSNWKLIDQYPDTEARNTVYSIMEKLAYLDFTELGATKDEYDRFPYLRFDAKAQVVFNEWLTDLQINKLPNEPSPLMTEHLGKYRSLMPSLALIFHLIEIAETGEVIPVSERAVVMAGAWCEYLESHARRIYGLATSPEMQAAMALADKIMKGAVEDGFSPRDVYRHGWADLNNDGTYLAIAVLQDYSWLKVEAATTPAGGRPTQICRINPLLGIGK